MLKNVPTSARGLLVKWVLWGKEIPDQANLEANATNSLPIVDQRWTHGGKENLLALVPS